MNNKQIMQTCTEDYKTSLGTIYKVPKQSCALCEYCESIIIDWRGPYLFNCDKAIDENGIMDVYKMGGPYGNCEEFKSRS